MKTIKHPENAARLWDGMQVRSFVEQVVDRVGASGWGYLSSDMREAMIAEKALTIAIGSARGDVPCAALHCLRLDMLRQGGMLE